MQPKPRSCSDVLSGVPTDRRWLRGSVAAGRLVLQRGSAWFVGALLLLTCWVGVVRADSSWTRITLRDGLPHDTIRSLTPTTGGGVLIGTSDGLAQWDGERLISYSAGNGLAPGTITAVANLDGELWAGSWGGGLSALSGDRWRRYTADDSAGEDASLPGDWISALAADGNVLWVGFYGRGLLRMEGEGHIHATRANSGLPSDWVDCLLPDGEGGVWAGSERGGLARWTADGEWERYDLSEVDAGNAVTALALRGTELWVGTRRGVAVRGGNGAWQVLGRATGLPQGRVTALAVAPDNSVWIGTDGGLAHWEGGAINVYTVAEGLPYDSVSALAFDGRGRLWVGTLVRGIAVRGRVELSKVERPPVVLVHGWRGPESDLLEDSEFWHLARWLREDGFSVYYASGISPENTLYQNATRLREVIAEARSETGAPAVYLIGFSMGGLNSRAYLESTLYQSDVVRAFILGTPHRGEHLWQTFLLWEYLAWTDEPSALELLPLHASLFNVTHDNALGVPYTIIAGDARATELPTLFSELPRGDGLVSTWSALGTEREGVDRRVTDDLHAYAREIIVLGVPSLLYPRDTYAAHIRPYLLGTVDALGTGPYHSAEGYGPIVLDPRTALRAGTIQPGETLALPEIPIDGRSRATFMVRWKGDPLDMRLQDPRGRPIDADTPASDDDIEFLELGIADFASYVITDAMPGAWQVILEAHEENVAASEYVVYASFASPLRLEVAADSAWYHAGETMRITASLEGAVGPLEGLEVRVDSYWPSKQRETVPLTPVADQPPEAPPLFAGTILAPSDGGYSVLLVQVTGRHSDEPFERGGALVVGTYGDGASLAGDAELVLRTEGQEERTVARVEVNARREGDYLLSVEVADTRGLRTARVAHPVRLSEGRQVVEVPVADAAIDASGLLAPLHVVDVLLVDIGGAGVLVDYAPQSQHSAGRATVLTDGQGALPPQSRSR